MKKPPTSPPPRGEQKALQAGCQLGWLCCQDSEIQAKKAPLWPAKTSSSLLAALSPSLSLSSIALLLPPLSPFLSLSHSFAMQHMLRVWVQIWLWESFAATSTLTLPLPVHGGNSPFLSVISLHFFCAPSIATHYVIALVQSDFRFSFISCVYLIPFIIVYYCWDLFLIIINIINCYKSFQLLSTFTLLHGNRQYERANHIDVLHFWFNITIYYIINFIAVFFVFAIKCVVGLFVVGFFNTAPAWRVLNLILFSFLFDI